MRTTVPVRARRTVAQSAGAESAFRAEIEFTCELLLHKGFAGFASFLDFLPVLMLRYERKAFPKKRRLCVVISSMFVCVHVRLCKSKKGCTYMFSKIHVYCISDFGNLHSTVPCR